MKQENMMVPLTLGAVLCLLRYFDSGNGRWRDAAAVMAGLCALTKTTGLYLGVVVVLLLLMRRQWRDAVRATVICLGFFSLYLVYGWWYDWEVFQAVVAFMGSFTARLDSGMQFIRDGKLIADHFGDGWNLWLWLALVYASTKEDKVLPLTIVVYWLALSVSACGNAVYGWYRIPLYPLLCICSGVYIADLFRKPNLARAAIFVLVCLAATGQYAFPEHWTATFALCRPLLALACLPFFVHALWENPRTLRLARVGLGLALLAFVILNIVAVLNFADAYYVGNIRSPLR